MMTGLDLPAGGCWELVPDFKGEHLNYVISLRQLARQDRSAAASSSLGVRGIRKLPDRGTLSVLQIASQFSVGVLLT